MTMIVNYNIGSYAKFSAQFDIFSPIKLWNSFQTMIIPVYKTLEMHANTTLLIPPCVWDEIFSSSFYLLVAFIHYFNGGPNFEYSVSFLSTYIYIEISLIFIWSAYSGVGNNFEILSVNIQIVHSVSKEKLPQQKKIYSEVKVWIKYNNWYMVLWAEICGERKKINWNSMSDKIFSRSILNGRKYIRTHFPPSFV